MTFDLDRYDFLVGKAITTELDKFEQEELKTQRAILMVILKNE